MSQSLRTITKISRQKSTDRYNVFLDEHYAFSVSEDVLVKKHLHKGLTLSEQDIATIQKHDSWHRSYLQAIRYLSYRMRSTEEIRHYLRKKDVESIVIEEIIVKLQKENYLNDLAFAKAFVRDRMNQSTKGPLLIANELEEKGVSAKIIEEAIKEYTYDAQFQTALNWAQKQQKRKSSHAYRKRKAQLKSKLYQKGYSSDVINAVFEEIRLEPNLEEEKKLLEHQAEKLLRKYQKNYTGSKLRLKLKTSLYRRGFPSELISEYVAKLDETL